MDWLSLLIQIVVSVIVLAPVLWIVGRLLVGKDKAKFTDAILIVVLGVVVGAIASYFLSYLDFGWLIGAIVSLIIWLGLIKHFFDCGWLKALAIGIVVVIVYIIIAVIIGFILAALILGAII